jgi:hypothetical protein
MALLTVLGGEARTMVSRGNTPRGDSATAGYAGSPAGQGVSRHDQHAKYEFATLNTCSNVSIVAMDIL